MFSVVDALQSSVLENLVLNYYCFSAIFFLRCMFCVQGSAPRYTDWTSVLDSSSLIPDVAGLHDTALFPAVRAYHKNESVFVASVLVVEPY